MLQTVDVGVESLENYRPFVKEGGIEEIQKLAASIKGARILHLNATPYGGGVSELLRSQLPIMRDLGLDADWKVIFGDDKFFGVTKSFHNALQGQDFNLTQDIRDIYLKYNVKNAKLLEEEYDFIIVHDPQPLALRHFNGRGKAKWVWRCHIDTSEPNQEVWDFLAPYVGEYDASIFTLRDFVPPGFGDSRVSIIPPAIDPLSPKNMAISASLCRRVISWVGVDLKKPLLVQVSRFDPWKDPEGVIDVYRLVKQEIPNLQLALVGSMALDDPEAWEIYARVVDYAKRDDDAYVFTNLTGVGNIEVNAFQQLAQVVIQKSIREGFGLIVSETLWKGTPVVAGRTGGIPLQLEDGKDGFLCENTEEYAEKVSYLFKNHAKAKEMGEHGRETVRNNFLTPRLVADELRCLAAL